MRLRHPVLRVVLVVVAVAATAAVVFALARSPSDEGSTDPHGGVGRLSEDERDEILRAVDAESTDVPRAALVAEGRRLFNTTEGVKAGESCAACHTGGGGANADVGTIVHPQREGDFRGARDPLALWGVSDTAPYGWDGREPSLEAFVAGTIRSHFTEGEDQPAETTARQAAAIAAYLETLEPPRTDFDRGTLSPAARRGEEIFVGKGACAACHVGPLLTDNGLHNTLTPPLEAGDTDTGAARSGRLRGAFNTPQLRDVRNTAPYMHNGSLETLRDVVEFYDRRSSIAPLQLTPNEIEDLVAYLESL
jgi:cytochrome c peroxidase